MQVGGEASSTLLAQTQGIEPRQAAQFIIEHASGASAAPIRQKNKKKLPPAPGGTYSSLKEARNTSVQAE